MLRVLGGTQVGAFGRLALEPAFMDALDRHHARGQAGCARIAPRPPG
jgi:hypothetical protein